jgi:ATP-dependent Lon protease
VNSANFDLLYPLSDAFDLAVMDRFYTYLPGWGVPKNISEQLTGSYGFITDYRAEAFHHLFLHTNRYDWVNKHLKLGKSVEGRDEVAIKKTVCAFLKLLHPLGDRYIYGLRRHLSRGVKLREIRYRAVSNYFESGLQIFARL